MNCTFLIILVLGMSVVRSVAAVGVEPVAAQPLAANVRRLNDALDFLGAPLPKQVRDAIRRAVDKRDSEAMQRLLDAHALLVVELNPESRVKVRRGDGPAVLQQGGYVPAIIKVINHSTVTKELLISSPQAGPVYAGMTELSAKRMQREALRETATKTADTTRFLEAEMYTRPPMTERLSGLEVEYAIALLYSRDAGKLEATIALDVGQGTQDLGFRAEVPVLFDVRPAVPVTLRVRDADGSPTTAGLTFRDGAGHVFPPQAKRLAPDFYFQAQIYRHDGEQVLLPPGRLTVEFWRGPEYRRLQREVDIPSRGTFKLSFDLKRWIDPARFGFYSGDHHIHGAGCAHYSEPTQGVTPMDMFKQVEGEGLNVGCVLTWGPCFTHQRKFFSPGVDVLSRAFTLMKYDLEISGFGSEALGHVCLLNLKDQNFPGSDGTKTKGWPSWTVPVMRWAKEQGGVTGYAHSGSGLEINSRSATQRFFGRYDTKRDGTLTPEETRDALLPYVFADVDSDHDGALTESELAAAHDRAADELPNFAVPEMNGVGAMEICVSVAAGVCDFISAMDTPRIAEWNMWYHLLNCGFPLKASGETDFPCMSGERVGQGRVYVQLGQLKRLDFGDWCRALAQGRSYVSDGFAYALRFRVNDVAPGFGDVRLDSPGEVEVMAEVAFSPESPALVAHGLVTPPGGKRWTGDTVTLHGPRSREILSGGTRTIEIVMNGQSVATRQVPADGRTHEVRLQVRVERSSWVALRQFPQLHTNPINVLVDNRPVRASRDSARWCIETIEQLWRGRSKSIREEERASARNEYDRAISAFRQIADETPAVR